MQTGYSAIVQFIKDAQKRGDERLAQGKPQVTVTRLDHTFVSQCGPIDPALSYGPYRPFDTSMAGRHAQFTG
jgi:hypothetical protein